MHDRMPCPRRQDSPSDHVSLVHLERLEAESVHIIREVVAACERPVMLYSIGKDSSADAAPRAQGLPPGRPPFPLLHVDTTWKFRDMYAFRDRIAAEHGLELIVHVNEEGLRRGINPFDHGSAVHTDVMKTRRLKQALDVARIRRRLRRRAPRRGEVARQGARLLVPLRPAPLGPEEPAPRALAPLQRAQAPGRVDPRLPALQLDRARRVGLHRARAIPIVPLYLAAERAGGRARRRADHGRRRAHALEPGETPQRRACASARSAATRSPARSRATPTASRRSSPRCAAATSEREGRVIDHDGAASMERKKQEGYF
jgi:sulfate adenylyltransferase subunit 2